LRNKDTTVPMFRIIIVFISCENIEDDIMYLNIGNLEDLQKKRLFIIVSNVQYFGIILIINTSFNVSFNFNVILILIIMHHYIPFSALFRLIFMHNSCST